MFDFLGNLFNTDGFPPRWYCGSWSDGLGWLHVISDSAIFAAYTAIPIVLAFFVLRRGDIPFHRIFWLFAVFIFACGFGHLIEAIIFWHPVYRFAGAVKLTTAIASWLTVIGLAQVVPQALNLPGLARLNSQLREEVEERKRVELALRASEEKLASLLDSEREARSDAERANRIKDEFLSTVSHELRTPLNAVLGYAQLLLRGPKNDEETTQGLGVIERNAKIQAEIIEDLLDMSRIISGKVRLDAKTIDMAQIVESAVATVRPAAEAKGIRLQVVLDRNACLVFGDPGRLQQVIWNLLNNAVKFTPKDGRVQVALERVNSHLELRVSDTGQGIHPDFLPFVFDRFRQADTGTSRVHGGLGLGLSIVKQLVELHGGTISVQSPGDGQGATFTVSLPVQIVHGDAPPQPARDGRMHDTHVNTARVNLSGLKVLVVDDEPDSRELVKRLLDDYRAQVTLAGSVDEALEACRREAPDIVVSDIGMPHRDGYDLIRAVRGMAEQDGGKAPAIALTALARAEDRKRALLSGYQAHVSKPVDAGELVAVIASLTGRTGR